LRLWRFVAGGRFAPGCVGLRPYEGELELGVHWDFLFEIYCIGLRPHKIDFDLGVLWGFLACASLIGLRPYFFVYVACAAV